MKYSCNDCEEYPLILKEIEEIRNSNKEDIIEKSTIIKKYYNKIIQIYYNIHKNLNYEESFEYVQKNPSLKEATYEAIITLGGVNQINSFSLKKYDNKKFGPYLGISNAGDFADTIREAIFSSPKIQSLQIKDPTKVGIAIDAERIGSVGELPVGPEEYAKIWLECVGRLLISTNVGAKVNIRHYNTKPTIIIPKGPYEKIIKIVKNEIDKRLFDDRLLFDREIPGFNTLYFAYHIKTRRKIETRIKILKELKNYVNSKKTNKSGITEIGLQFRIGLGKRGFNGVMVALKIAEKSGLKKVQIDGIIRRSAIEKISYPGLLNYLNPYYVELILKESINKGIKVKPKYEIDPETVARSIWGSLNSARQMGLALGKYGLYPLSMEEMGKVMKKIEKWFINWTAAPVFFADQDCICEDAVYTRANICDGILKWLDIVHSNSIPVVLIDTLDKSKKWKILKEDQDSKGLLTKQQITTINTKAEKLGIKVLWAGGIDILQIQFFKDIEAFGIYITSSIMDKKSNIISYNKVKKVINLLK